MSKVPIRYTYNHERREFTISAPVLARLLQDMREIGKDEIRRSAPRGAHAPGGRAMIPTIPTIPTIPAEDR